MQISSSLSGVSGYGAMRSAFAAQDMDEMDKKLATDIMSARDTDKSGGLSTSELGTSAEKLAEFDTDGDGQVSQAELEAGMKAKREKMQASMQNKMLQDGQMGMLQAGMMGMQGMNMGQMDTKMAQGIFSEKDADSDGLLTASELGVSAENLGKVDTDGDGFVNESELTTALKGHREQMMAENGGQMPPPPPPSGTEKADGGVGKRGLDNLISGLFGESGATASATSSSDDASSLSGSLADFLLRQKAANAYQQNMDSLIASLFGGSSGSESSLSLSA